MCISSVGEAQGDVLVFSDTEANLEFGEGTNHELVASRMSLTTSWVVSRDNKEHGVGLTRGSLF